MSTVAAPARAPALVRAEVVHRRTRPFDYRFSTRTPMWLVDIDDPGAAFPTWARPLASIRAVDHFAADDDRSLPAKVRGFLDGQQLSWSAHRVLMLTNARSLGYVFDPLTTYFCFDGHGGLEGVLAEVHNTYGERHCYPLPLAGPTAGQGGQAHSEVGKDFYVSPFFTVEGRYDIRTRLTDAVVAVAITLTQRGEPVFTASVHGALQSVTPARVLRTVTRFPLPSLRVSALIRWHGVKLWLRRLPVVPRRPHRAPEGMHSA